MQHAGISPFAPPRLPEPQIVPGVRLAAVEAGIRYKGRKDLLLVLLDEGTIAAGVLTKSRTCSAAVLWCRERLLKARARALVVNSGNSNAFTGYRGEEAVRITAKAAADAAGCSLDEVYIASTGVIGEPLQPNEFVYRLQGMAETARPDAWHSAAQAIMTTDTFPKMATTKVMLANRSVTLSGIAKGSGMIAPDMATMLGFIFTDAKIDPALLQDMTAEIVETTFNCITVDGDTSTSDTLLVFATGASGGETIADAGSAEAVAFKAALHSIVHRLALLVVKDGEGISKFVTINVTGAEHAKAARRIALSVANSPLVKTALAGEDANWGRVVMAIGKAGEAADRDKIKIQFGSHLLAEQGLRAPDYDENAISAYMKNAEIEISVDVGVGDGQATVWTCDLTHGYISINGDYRS